MPIPADGIRFRMQRCKFGWVEYNGCVTIHVSARGLHLPLWWVFRFGHPTMCIPWSALHVREVIDKWWRHGVIMSIGQSEIARLQAPLKIIEAAERWRLELPATPTE